MTDLMLKSDYGGRDGDGRIGGGGRKLSYVIYELEILLSKECLVCTLPFFKLY